MNYTLTYTEINIDSEDFQIDNTIFENKQEVYFIPSPVFDILKRQLELEDNNNYVYINKFLKIVNILLKTQNEISYLNLKNIDNNYKSFINSFKDVLIDSRSPYTTEQAFKYNIKAHNKWTFLMIEELDTLFIKDYNNELPKDHVCNNDQYISTLCNATINIEAAVKAEYDYYLKQKLWNDKKIITMSPERRNKAFAINVINILRFTNTRYIKKGNKIDRVFNSFCELSSRSRKYVNIENSYFLELDVKNCMPLLLALFLLKEDMKVDSDYIKAVTDGTFYRSIQIEAKESNVFYETVYSLDTCEDFMFDDIDDVKRLVCSSVLYYSKSVKQSKTTEIFQRLYPKTYTSLQNIFKNDNKPAGYFFNLEANIMLNIVPKCYYFTVHDAIYVIDNIEAIRVKEELISKIQELTNGKLIANIRVTDMIEVYKSNSKCEVNKIDIISKRKKETNKRAIKSGTEKRYLEFIKLYEVKHTIQDIATKLNTSTKTIKRYMKSYEDKI